MRTNNHLDLDPQRWSLIESLYHSARQLEPEARRTFLAESCSGDETLYDDVMSLIHSDETGDSFLEVPAFSEGLRAFGQPREELSGITIDRYKLISRLGSGGMGDVYLARDLRLNRQIALKLLSPTIVNDGQSLLRFEQEARAASAIVHPNVAHIYEINDSDDRHFITMEYVAGPTLRQVLKQGGLDTRRAVNIAAEILSALVVAHEAGVIHRDIKPENVVLAGGVAVKVLDFGLAKVVPPKRVDDDSSAEALSSLHTTPELLMGTSHYMSPEQIRRGPIDARTDLWSVGVVLYEMLCERRPFPGQDFGHVMVAVLEEPPLPFATGKTTVPLILQEFLQKALSKAAADRFRTAGEMLASLREIETELTLDSTNSAASSIPFPKSPIEQVMDSRATAATRRDRSTNRIPAAEIPPRTILDPLPSRVGLWQRFGWAQKSVALALITLLVGSAGYFFFFRHRPRAFTLKYTDLNLNGVYNDLVISPDGKFGASVETVQGNQEIHLKEFATSVNLPVVPATGSIYSGLSFSPDGNYLYYLVNQSETATLFRVPKLGGSPQRILDNVNTAVTFSPDGKQIAFIRHNIPQEIPELVIAQQDGSSPRVIARRTKQSTDLFPIDMLGAGPAWSADGTKIACPTVTQAQELPEMNVDLVDVNSGESTRLNREPWFQILRLTWLADNTGLVLTGARSLEEPAQISFVSYPDGDDRALSNDPNNYIRISAALDSQTLLALKLESKTNVWAGHVGGAGFEIVKSDQQKNVSGLGVGPRGSVLTTVADGKFSHLWVQETAQKNTKQLTFDPVQDWEGVFSPDGTQIVFVSTRAKTSNLWIMDADGSAPRQLTFGTYEDMPTISPDGRWVVYRTATNLKRVPITGGNPEQIFDQGGISPAISPDGNFVAAFVNIKNQSQWHLAVVDLRTKTQVKDLVMSEATKQFGGLDWSPDGKELIYVSSTAGIDNLWRQPLAGGAAAPFTSFSDGEITSFFWSRDSSRRIFCLRTQRTYVPLLVALR